MLARSYLVKEKPDAILNIVDGTNIERNLYLTTQLIELGLPVVVAVNMIDLVRKNGDTIDLAKLGSALGCEVVEMSALKGEGGMAAAERAVALAQKKQAGELPHVFTGSVEHTLAHIEESIQGKVTDSYLRWYAIKIFERDEKVMEELSLPADLKSHLEEHIEDCEREMDDDAESIITNQRYSYINTVVSKAVRKKAAKHSLSVSDKIDQVVTNRILALPIFVAVMFLVYALAMGGWGVSIGTAATDWANDGLFGDGWFLPFSGSDVDGYDEASGAFEEASAIIEAYEGGDPVAYLYDADAGEVSTLEVTAESYAEALTVEEPDPASYGTYVPGLVYNKLIREFGIETARLYLQANQEALDQFCKLCRETGCDFEEKDAFVYSRNDRRKIEKEITALEQLGFSASFETELPLPFSIAGAVCFPQQAQFHPLKFLGAIARSLRIFEHTKVLELMPGRALTTGGTVSAKKIIIATHFPAALCSSLRRWVRAGDGPSHLERHVPGRPVRPCGRWVFSVFHR